MIAWACALSANFCAALALAWANATAAERQHIGLYFDQDFLLPAVNEDRDYTMGIAMEMVVETDAKGGQGLSLFDNQLKRLGEALGAHDPDQRIRRSYMIGAVNFTPEDLAVSEPQFDDRPYSSVLFLANKRVYADQARAVGIEAQLGLLGTSVAREVQTAVHQAWRDSTGDDEPVDPQGWDNQISAGGEPTARLRFAYARRIDKLSLANRFDIAWTGDVSLGYQTNVSLGLSARAGLLGSPFWTIPYDPINRGNFLPSYSGQELYVWGALRSRLIGYDALLQGQFRDSAVTFNSSDLNRLVHDAGIGITGSLYGAKLTLSANLKTAELNRGKADRTHWWGGTYLTLAF